MVLHFRALGPVRGRILHRQRHIVPHANLESDHRTSIHGRGQLHPLGTNHPGSRYEILVHPSSQLYDRLCARRFGVLGRTGDRRR